MVGISSTHHIEGAGKTIRPAQRFTPGSVVSHQRDWLVEAGVAGVDDLNGPDVRRLSSEMGIQEVEAAIEEANRIGGVIGITPEVHGLDLAVLVRLARASKDLSGDKDLADRVISERANLYVNLALSAGALAVGDTILDD